MSLSVEPRVLVGLIGGNWLIAHEARGLLDIFFSVPENILLHFKRIIPYNRKYEIEKTVLLG
jgi:hypothetical protein